MSKAQYKEYLEKGDNELIQNKDFKKAEEYYQMAMDSHPLGIDGINAMIVCKKLQKVPIDGDL